MKLKHQLWLLALLLAIDCLLAAGLWFYLPFPGSGRVNSVSAGWETPDANGKIVALTFDDGPHPDYTEKLLDGLKQRDVKASFFLIAESIKGNEELVKRMSLEGHLIGIHCYRHKDLTQMPLEQACQDIMGASEMIKQITGREPEYIRPPFGAWSYELEDCIGMTAVYWDIDPLDWKHQNRQQTVRHILKNAGKHEVILLHDVYATSVEAALEVVDTLIDQGYTFVTVDEMLID